MTKQQFSSVWTREPRQPKAAGLRRDQIVAAAIEVLDADGLGALSMRKLGAKLDAGATSLYWHVANKDELLELVLDEIWGLVRIPDPDQASWREVVTTYAYNFRLTMLDHTWVTTLIGSLPSVGPKAFELSDRLRRSFIGAGFTGIDIYLASSTVTSYVLGQVIPEITAAKAFGDKGFDKEMVLDVMDELASGYPEMLADYRNMQPADYQTARAMAFDFGLLCVMDGLESRLRK
ncbi:TetR/AcrR family transcriptional regulator C-terminal domain-containing protein [Nocardia vinacea]|uniref:TetR/AcrR family transcriptional regulator C-terminal domain-containing protein n=1 Tax=Nocardia vinacea TaxID=96468 RepID=A0ABZ1YKV3_9NOCA|nr:TetR/AcrR family transcriptional regulator C-terminal domain-containing protein [Nocardia vinacea]